MVVCLDPIRDSWVRNYRGRYGGVALACRDCRVLLLYPGRRRAVNDNVRKTLIGGGFRLLGVALFVGAIAGGMWHPTPWWMLMGITGFAMVMV